MGLKIVKLSYGALNGGRVHHLQDLQSNRLLAWFRAIDAIVSAPGQSYLFRLCSGRRRSAAANGAN